MVESPSETLSVADPERRLMLAHVRADRRAALAALWMLDERLGQVVATTTERAIGAIRLIWWRDALLRLDLTPAPGEPLLRTVSADLLSHVPGAVLSPMAESWGAVLDDLVSDAELEEHGRLRGGTLFAIAATVLGGDPETVRAAGAGWALADLAHGMRDPVLRSAALAAAGRALTNWGGRVPTVLRPLGMLGALARIDVRAGSEIERRQGGPRRIATMLRYGLIGR